RLHKLALGLPGVQDLGLIASCVGVEHRDRAQGSAIGPGTGTRSSLPFSQPEQFACFSTVKTFVLEDQAWANTGWKLMPYKVDKRSGNRLHMPAVLLLGFQSHGWFAAFSIACQQISCWPRRH
ncbi:hypothetical protein P7K49_014845, partial [Saguinus oedipus]